jgi:hypothetical protein
MPLPAEKNFPGFGHETSVFTPIITLHVKPF